MSGFTSYCPSCRKECELVDATSVTLPLHGKTTNVWKGVCAICGASLYAPQEHLGE